MAADKHDELNSQLDCRFLWERQARLQQHQRQQTASPACCWDDGANKQFEGAKVDDMVLFQESGPITSI